MRALAPALLLLLAASSRTAAPTSPDAGTAATSQDAGTVAPQPPPLSPEDEEAARALVEDNCLSCHTRAMLEQQRLTSRQWEGTVTKMRKWGSPLEEENAALLVRYLSAHYNRSAGPYEPPAIDAARAAAQLAPLPDGRYAKGAAKKGQELFQTRCATCHGADGRGAALGTNVVDRTILYRAPELAALVRKGRGRMPGFDTTDADIAALIAYLRTLRP